MFILAVALICVTQLAVAADAKYGLKPGDPGIKSAGPLGFGPEGILFVGDTQQGAIYAIDTGDVSGNPSGVTITAEKINESIAGMLGISPRDVLINDMVVNPRSGNVYLSVARGREPDAAPAVIRLDASGKYSEVSLKNATFAKAELPNPVAPGGQGKAKNARSQSITDLAYVDGRVFVAGLSNEEFQSNLRSIPFPFSKVDTGTSVEIYHGNHAAYETRSPVRTFVPFQIKGESHLLAAYTCTPLVKFRVSELKSGEKVRGVTIAELGNRNNPLDMIVYQRDGKDYLLLANSARGVMKITTETAADEPAITARVQNTAGLKYETIAQLQGVTQLDRLNDKNAVVLLVDEAGNASLKTVPLP
jgi:hypothetical protein